MLLPNPPDLGFKSGTESRDSERFGVAPIAGARSGRDPIAESTEHRVCFTAPARPLTLPPRSGLAGILIGLCRALRSHVQGGIGRRTLSAVT